MTDAQSAQSLTPVERFLTCLVRSALKSGLHTPTELVERFPPDAIMSFLDTEPAKRARILIEVLGFPAKTAHNLSSTDAGVVLQTAFEAEEAQPSKIVEALEPADIARHFPKVALWALLDDGEWWMKPKADKPSAKDFAFTAVSAMWSNGLADFERTLDRLSIVQLARFLPKDLLEVLFEDAVKGGLRKEPFEPERVFRIVTAQKLVDQVPLEALHAKLLVPLADDHGLTRSAMAPKPPADEEPGPATQAATPRTRSNPVPAEGDRVMAPPLPEDAAVAVTNAPATDSPAYASTEAATRPGTPSSKPSARRTTDVPPGPGAPVASAAAETGAAKVTGGATVVMPPADKAQRTRPTTTGRRCLRC